MRLDRLPNLRTFKVLAEVAMSFDIFLQRFSGGAAEGSPKDLLCVIRLLVSEQQDGCARLTTEGGGCDLYGFDKLATGFMVDHASGRAVWDLLFELARAMGPWLQRPPQSAMAT